MKKITGRHIELGLTLIMAISAVSVAWTVYRSAATDAREMRPTYVAAWEHGVSYGTLVHGDGTSDVSLMVMMDLECPACRVFHRTLDLLVAESATNFDLLYLPFPLDYHQYAVPAARAAQCARQAGFYKEFVDVLFQKQDSLGLKSWDSYAIEAGLTDSALVAHCLTSAEAVTEVEEAITWAKQALPDIGTPSVLVNGWLYTGGLLTVEELQGIIQRASKGERPGILKRDAVPVS